MCTSTWEGVKISWEVCVIAYLLSSSPEISQQQHEPLQNPHGCSWNYRWPDPHGENSRCSCHDIRLHTHTYVQACIIRGWLRWRLEHALGLCTNARVESWNLTVDCQMGKCPFFTFWWRIWDWNLENVSQKMNKMKIAVESIFYILTLDPFHFF